MIKIGISACLLGQKVRYDGGHKLNPFLRDVPDMYHVEYVPVCPEFECGLGVPRKPMHLQGNPEAPRLIVTDTGQDLTDLMLGWSQNRVIELQKQGIRGFIFKSNSPSCGIKYVDVFSQKSLPSKTGAGIFAAIFMKHFPSIPAEDEKNLNDSALIENFMAGIFASAKNSAK